MLALPLSRFILMLELAVRFGKTLVLQDVQSIDPILFPILRRDLAGQGLHKGVQIGEKMVDFNPSFRFSFSYSGRGLVVRVAVCEARRPGFICCSFQTFFSPRAIGWNQTRQ